jgi:hypothetical protein
MYKKVTEISIELLVRELTCDELFEEKQRDRERHEMT